VIWLAVCDSTDWRGRRFHPGEAKHLIAWRGRGLYKAFIRYIQVHNLYFKLLVIGFNNVKLIMLRLQTEIDNTDINLCIPFLCFRRAMS